MSSPELLRWGSGPRVVVALHGITSNAMVWQTVASHLSPEWTLVALDQRGRGRSRDLPGPYDAEQLARDAATVVTETGAEVLAGHSMGAYIALGAGHHHAVPRLVLVDGGLPLPAPPGDPDAALDDLLGASLRRLSTVFPGEDSYVDFFRAHPGYAASWTPQVEDFARYDALAVAGGVRPRALPEAVRVSGRELLLGGDRVAEALAGLQVPADLLVAERGMDDLPPGFLPDEVIADWTARQPLLSLTRLDDVNHDSMMFDQRSCAAIAQTIMGA